jgi:hypothetical protein
MPNNHFRSQQHHNGNGLNGSGPSGTAKPEPAKPSQVKPELAMPELVKPEPAMPEQVKPEQVKPELAKPEQVKPEPASSDNIIPVAPVPSIPVEDMEHLRYQPQAQPQPVVPAPREVYNPLQEVPTLTQQIAQDIRKDVNEALGKDSGRSLNEALKGQQKEVSMLLTETPIRDLKRAIGINDRYLFISELFRGDEVMYERSIKTINNFSIYQEAYYWMERELKLKLAWDMEKYSSQLFYQLVKRRFS